MSGPAARDVILMKPMKQHVLVNTADSACLSVIGFATLARGEESQTDDTESSSHGFRWAAPEVLENGKFSEQSDVFSFGFVAAEVYS